MDVVVIHKPRRKKYRPMENLTLGACCACEREGPTVRNIISLSKKALVPGHGWGCVVCDLPCDGANAVCCDVCLDLQRPLKFACRGYPGEDGRAPIEEFTEPFDHDFSKHEEMM